MQVDTKEAQKYRPSHGKIRAAILHPITLFAINADMSNAFLYVTGGCLIVSSALVHFFVARRRHRRDLREFLEPELRKRGVQFVSAVYPGIFKVGPFPKFEVTVGRPQSTVLGFRGEYSEYRIVTFKNGKDEAQQLWAKVDFELFRFARVRWRAEHKESLPPALLPILEA